MNTTLLMGQVRKDLEEYVDYKIDKRGKRLEIQVVSNDLWARLKEAGLEIYYMEDVYAGEAIRKCRGGMGEG